MKSCTVILPHQLFDKQPAVKQSRDIYIIEHARFFSAFNFHKLKIMLHRASMQDYYAQLKKGKYTVLYVSHDQEDKLWKSIATYDEVHIVDPIDHDLHQLFEKKCKQLNVRLNWHESPMFLTSQVWIDKHIKKDKKRFLMNSFYKKQRKRLDILIKQGKPVGGQWSLDEQNREKLSDDIEIPALPDFSETDYVQEARKYVHKHFKKNPGQVDDFIYPTNKRTAHHWLKSFLEKRFEQFGPYQDAMRQGESFLFHSVLSSTLNIGLLTPEYVVDQALEYAQEHDVPINSLEGFIRQIIGWREFVRIMYQVIGKEQKKANFFNCRKHMPDAFYKGKTGIDPVDSIIKKLHKTAYSHHIERLMILGNIMLLCQIKPDDVYTWFMELYIDAYDWVMVPNVYGMSQFADTRMTTKPYISSSNYVLKMSDYKKGDWCDIWDSLFWSFVQEHKKKLSDIGRMHFIMNILGKKTKKELKEHQKNVDSFWKKCRSA